SSAASSRPRSRAPIGRTMLPDTRSGASAFPGGAPPGAFGGGPAPAPESGGPPAPAVDGGPAAAPGARPAPGAGCARPASWVDPCASPAMQPSTDSGSSSPIVIGVSRYGLLSPAGSLHSGGLGSGVWR